MDHAFGVVSWNALLSPRSQIFCLTVSFRSFIDLGFTFWSLINFKLIFSMVSRRNPSDFF